ncbi:MAG: YaeQ family protein, partial [Gemmatimonadota bacterium]|nr:YaeQ family protein [Gemmatimonadota bacterium]
ARLHKASKNSPRVAVYMHKDPTMLLRAWSAANIYRAEKLELYAMDRELLAELVRRLDRRLKFDLSVTEGELYIDIGGRSLSGSLQRLSL